MVSPNKKLQLIRLTENNNTQTKITDSCLFIISKCTQTIHVKFDLYGQHSTLI